MSESFLDWRSCEAFPNLPSLFEQRAAQHPNRLLVSAGDARLTWGDGLKAVRGFAEAYGDAIRGGDVALFMGNSAAFLITYLGVLYSGGCPALINGAMPRKAGEKLMDSLASRLVFSDHPLEFHQDAIIVDAGLIENWVSRDAGRPNCAGHGGDPAHYFYSGGTTGVPKRILYTHERMMAAGARMQWGWPLHEGEIFLPIAPYSHIYGFLSGIALPLQCGGSSILPSRFHPAEILELIERERVTVLGGGPPAIYQAIMSSPDISRRDLSSLRVCPGGGASFPVEVHRRWKTLTGLTIHEGYGMTEVAPIAVNTDEAGTQLGSVGKVVPDTEIDIVDIETGQRVLGAGEAGEIRVRGPHVMPGYSDNPEETAIVLRDGWIYTGDVGVLDENSFLTITDRKKDVIIFKGYNVFPREVEEAVISHPSVAGVCVCGVPDERSGEMVLAYVALRQGETVTAEAIAASCAAHLVPYKMPGRIEFLEALPLTPAGKVDRMALKAMARVTASEAAA